MDSLNDYLKLEHQQYKNVFITKALRTLSAEDKKKLNDSCMRLFKKTTLKQRKELSKVELLFNMKIAPVIIDSFIEAKLNPKNEQYTFSNNTDAKRV